jgi:hypothetical protein
MNNYDEEESEPFLEDQNKVDYCWLVCYSIMIIVYSTLAGYVLYDFANH